MPLMQRLSYLPRQPHKLLHKRKRSFLQTGLLSVRDNDTFSTILYRGFKTENRLKLPVAFKTPELV